MLKINHLLSCLLFMLATVGCEVRHEEKLVSKNAIVGGEIVKDLKEPYEAIVKVYSDDFYCSGSLISPDIVLTAAHCLPEAYFDHRLTGNLPGVMKPSSTIHIHHRDGSVQTVHSQTMVAHENYHPTSWEKDESIYDMALIKLDRKILDVTPISVAWETPDKQKMEHAGLGQFTGRVDVADKSDGALRRMALTSPETQSIYLKFFESESGPCIGDSGGPLFIETKNGKQVAGILSFSLPHKVMTPDQLKLYVGASGQESDWDSLYEQYPDYDECKGGEFYFISTAALRDFLVYYTEKLNPN